MSCQDTIALIANGACEKTPRLIERLRDFKEVVAVDGGIVTCEKLGITPTLIIGDFDSAPQFLLQKFEFVTKIKRECQEKTDLEKALAYLFSKNTPKITVFGATGNRSDHSLYNFHLLTRYKERLFFESEHELCFVMDKKTSLTPPLGTTLSLIPLGGKVSHCTTSGLKWNLNEATLDLECASISNVTTSKEVEISISSGNLLVTLQWL